MLFHQSKYIYSEREIHIHTASSSSICLCLSYCSSPMFTISLIRLSLFLLFYFGRFLFAHSSIFLSSSSSSSSERVYLRSVLSSSHYCRRVVVACRIYNMHTMLSYHSIYSLAIPNYMYPYTAKCMWKEMRIVMERAQELNS